MWALVLTDIYWKDLKEHRRDRILRILSFSIEHCYNAPNSTSLTGTHNEKEPTKIMQDNYYTTDRYYPRPQATENISRTARMSTAGSTKESILLIDVPPRREENEQHLQQQQQQERKQEKLKQPGVPRIEKVRWLWRNSYGQMVQFFIIAIITE